MSMKMTRTSWCLLVEVITPRTGNGGRPRYGAVAMANEDESDDQPRERDRKSCSRSVVAMRGMLSAGKGASRTRSLGHILSNS